MFLSRCYYKLSANLKLCRLNNYYNFDLSFSACKYECAIRKSSQKCLCTPWNIPRVSMNDPPFCDMFGNLCFYLFMYNYQKDIPSNSDCNCLSDCQKITYSITDSRRPIGKYWTPKYFWKSCGIIHSGWLFWTTVTSWVMSTLSKGGYFIVKTVWRIISFFLQNRRFSAFWTFRRKGCLA